MVNASRRLPKGNRRGTMRFIVTLLLALFIVYFIGQVVGEVSILKRECELTKGCQERVEKLLK